ncbi:hypothetical protein SDC9_194243 [bioreactor metagenome]|uniref:Uncharacterized protein n=1 Tax=bioreactor metagenome TaxID=1076179 RepID=A0A645I794_9ZZZZ
MTVVWASTGAREIFPSASVLPPESAPPEEVTLQSGTGAAAEAASAVPPSEDGSVRSTSVRSALPPKAADAVLAPGAVSPSA